MGILLDVVRDIQNSRPRLLNFRSQTETADPQDSAAPVPEQLTFREAGQWPNVHPELDNVLPMEYRQKMLERETVKAKEYQNRKSGEMTINKVSNEYSMDPPEPTITPTNLQPNQFSKSIKFH